MTALQWDEVDSSAWDLGTLFLSNFEFSNFQVYDRRPANGAGFVCFGQHCVPSDSPVAQQLIAYTRGCLDALRITNGATHTEAQPLKTSFCNEGEQVFFVAFL